jgi:hypothetical protein
LAKGSALQRIVEHVIASTEPCQLFELYYWCQEPRLLRIVRACAALPDAQQRLIASFFDGLKETDLISANWTADGQLLLSCQSGRQSALASELLPENPAKKRATRR